MALSRENISNCNGLQRSISEEFETLIKDTEDLVRELNDSRVYTTFITGTDYGNKINKTLEDIRSVANGGLKDVNSKFSSSMAAFLERQEQLNEHGN